MPAIGESAGLKIVRHRKKYYMYLQPRCMRGDTVAFGGEIVASIPVGERYEAWLESERKAYDEISKSLEERLLTFDPTDFEEIYIPNSAVLPPKHYLWLDDRLSQLPSVIPMLYQFNGLYPSWAYLVDLDREIFSVNFGVHYKLNKIPRKSIWDWEFRVDSFRDITLMRDEPVGDCIADPEERVMRMEGSLLCEYSQLKVAKVPPPKVRLPVGYGDHHQIILMVLFERLSSRYTGLLVRFLLGWTVEDFVFRELAFAILSLASGQLWFDEPKLLEGNFNEGFFFVHDRDVSEQTPKLLSAFARGFHERGIAPGSAPDASIYWFEEVLVCLATHLEGGMISEKNIARTVKFGLKSGRKEFRAMLFSIEYFIMMYVRFHGGVTSVRRTNPIPLFNIDNHLSRDPRSRLADFWKPEYSRVRKQEMPHSSEAVGSPENLCSLHPGFLSLVNFFDRAAVQALHPASYLNEGIFPAEIYHQILSNIHDPRTYNNCAKVSRYFRAYVHHHVRVGGNGVIVKYEGDMKFLFMDRTTGKRDGLWLSRDTVKGEDGWHAVVGPPGRMSLLDYVSVDFRIMTLPDRLVPFLGSYNGLIRAVTSRSGFGGFRIYFFDLCDMRRDPKSSVRSSRNAPNANLLTRRCYTPTNRQRRSLLIPENAPLLFIQNLWESWLTRILVLESTLYPAESQCVLSTKCRELYLQLRKVPVRLFLHHPHLCGNSALTEEIWDDAIWRIRPRLELHASKSGFILVTFGTMMRIYWWTVRPNFEPRKWGVTGGELVDYVIDLDLSVEGYREGLERLLKRAAAVLDRDSISKSFLREAMSDANERFLQDISALSAQVPN